jgi:uncharacterized membrane protein YjfL (UPF0719 family)
MDYALLISGALQLAVALVAGALFLYGAFWIFGKTTGEMDEIAELKRNNVAAAILNAGVVVAAAIVAERAIEPSGDLITSTIRLPDAVVSDYLETTGLVAAHLALSMLAALFGVVFATRLFAALTRRIDEMAEIAEGNVAAAIVLAAVVVAVALLMREGVGAVLDALIPYPTFSVKDFGG